METTTKHWSVAQRRRLVEHWRSSGIGAREFAAAEGITVSRLWGWSSKIRRDGAPAAASMPSQPPKMLPVRVTAGGEGARYEIVTVSGRIVRASGDFDPMMLARLAAALDAGC